MNDIFLKRKTKKQAMGCLLLPSLESEHHCGGRGIVRSGFFIKNLFFNLFSPDNT
jgi:hypothetical protein